MNKRKQKINHWHMYIGCCIFCPLFFLAASWSSGRMQDTGLGSKVKSRVPYSIGASPRCAPESMAYHAVMPGANGYLWGQICKPWYQVACEQLYTPQGVEMDIQIDILTVKAQWSGKALVKVCRAELSASVWTGNSDYRFTYFWMESIRKARVSSCIYNIYICNKCVSNIGAEMSGNDLSAY